MSNHIDELVAERRRAFEPEPPGTDDKLALPLRDDPVWGLALSGGGIRSATFCFGLLHAFAVQKMLLRFDLVSTVSGGGYIGAMLGRLLQRATSFADVKAVVSALEKGNTTWFSWWLRANGRYLVPRGVKDKFFALAIYLRNLLGIHVELGIVGLLLGIVLALVNIGGWNLLAWQAGAAWPAWLETAREWLVWLPTPWLLLLLLAPLALVAVLVYWAVPLVARGHLSALIGIIAAAAFIAALLTLKALLLGSKGAGGALVRDVLWFAALATFVAWAFAIPVAHQILLSRRKALARAQWLAQSSAIVALVKRGEFRAALAGLAHAVRGGDPVGRQFATVEAQDAARNNVTKWLSWLLRAAAAIVVIGLLDRAAWWLAFEQQEWQQAGVGLAIAAAALRAALPTVTALQPGTRGVDGLLRLGSLLGRVLTFCLFTWWVAVVHKAALGTMFQPGGVDLVQAWRWPLAAIGLTALAYAVLTGWNVRFLNLSSLHGFYRARLVRSYLGASNPGRFARPGPLGAIDPMPPDPKAPDIKSVGDVDPQDDLPMTHYEPHKHGGPVHLINVCLNETKDPRGGLFNQDRRGRVLTIAPKGKLRLSQQAWRTMKPGPESLTLGSWMAISGAALAPGLGNLTRGGISALTMFAGGRLGYWWDSTAIEGVPDPKRLQPVKLRGVLRETFGVFGGESAPDWFLTDGGHFENTGAYALLAERCKLIVVADCGADPDYRFRDVENLVRKARIDFGAEIKFLRPRKEDELPERDRRTALPKEAAALLGNFGSLNDLASNTSCACFALAGVRYGDGSRAHLVLVKPNLCAGLPVDLFNFKAEHPQFPQQGTADQFFDEAQWESYFQLGKALGSFMGVQALEPLTQETDAWFLCDDGSPIESPAARPGSGTATGASASHGKASAPESRLPARLATGAVTASLGFGAAATAGVAAWQAIETVRHSFAEQVKSERAALKELADLWAKLPAGPAADPKASETASQLAATLARVSDTLCPSNEAHWFNQSPLAVDILQGARQACAQHGSQALACGWLLNASDPFAAGPRASCLAVGATLAEQRGTEQPCANYWGYDYRKRALPRCAHPKDPIAAARHSDRDRRLKLYEVHVFGAWELPKNGEPVLDTVCASITLNPKLYGRSEAGRAERYLKAWREAGVRISATEDLIAQAQMEGRARPIVPRVNRVRYHERTSRDCALELARLVQAEGWVIEPETPLTPTKPGSIDVWIVPPPPTEIAQPPVTEVAPPVPLEVVLRIEPQTIERMAGACVAATVQRCPPPPAPEALPTTVKKPPKRKTCPCAVVTADAAATPASAAPAR